MIDVRQRRGVRGSEYAWANSQRLQAALADAGIAYEHRKDLAPTTELRRLQYAEDDRRGRRQALPDELAPAYVDRYLSEILDRVDLDAFADSLAGDSLPALLCVERDPEACHRSLIAGRIAERRGLELIHLRP